MLDLKELFDTPLQACLVRVQQGFMKGKLLVQDDIEEGTVYLQSAGELDLALQDIEHSIIGTVH